MTRPRAFTSTLQQADNMAPCLLCCGLCTLAKVQGYAADPPPPPAAQPCSTREKLHHCSPRCIAGNRSPRSSHQKIKSRRKTLILVLGSSGYIDISANEKKSKLTCIILNSQACSIAYLLPAKHHEGVSEILPLWSSAIPTLLLCFIIGTTSMLTLRERMDCLQASTCDGRSTYLT